MNREDLNRLPCQAPPVENEADHFYVCASCGQAVDMRRLGDVFHHEGPGHSRLETDS